MKICHTDLTEKQKDVLKEIGSEVFNILEKNNIKPEDSIWYLVNAFTGLIVGHLVSFDIKNKHKFIQDIFHEMEKEIIRGSKVVEKILGIRK